jgi:hypothetical protein
MKDVRSAGKNTYEADQMQPMSAAMSRAGERDRNPFPGFLLLQRLS